MAYSEKDSDRWWKNPSDLNSKNEADEALKRLGKINDPERNKAVEEALNNPDDLLKQREAKNAESYYEGRIKELAEKLQKAQEEKNYERYVKEQLDREIEHNRSSHPCANGIGHCFQIVSTIHKVIHSREGFSSRPETDAEYILIMCSRCGEFREHRVSLRAPIDPERI